MLWFKRKAGQEVKIGDKIRVVIRECRRGDVTIGIDAPRDVRIVRDDAVNKEERQS